VAGIARSMSRTIAMKAFAAGDKAWPLSLNLGVERWLYLNGGTPVQAGRRRSHVLDRACERANEKARRGRSGGL
jgi:hypothetical protein